LSLEDLHLCTGISLSLLEGYDQGLYKPTSRERERLTQFGSALESYPTPLFMALYLDRRRLRLLREIMPHGEAERLSETRTYEAYHSALCEACASHAEELEQVIVADARKNGYDPAGHE
jgi:hypothetical protein